MTMYCLRRAAFRALSSTKSPYIPSKCRTISSLTTFTPRCAVPVASLPPLQRRWLADEAAAIQSELEADGATSAENVENSIASASESSPEPPKTEEQAAETVAMADTPTDTTAPQAQDTTESSTGSIASAAQTMKDVASHAASSVTGAVTSAGEAASEASGLARSSARALPDDASPTVYVGNLFFDVRGEDLKKEFGRAGTVLDTKIITDQRGLSKGFGYIEFDSVDSAAKAIELYNLQNFEGRRLTVQFSNPRGSPRRGSGGPYSPIRQDRPIMSPTKTLFIGNLSFDMADRDLNDLFREVKNVIDVRVAIDRRTGQPRGFAHADFIDITSAERALEELRGKMVCGRALRVDFSTSTGRAALGREREESPTT